MSGALHAPCDRSIALAVPADGGTASTQRMILATTILASSLAFIDGSIVNVGLPAIGRSLSASGEVLSWVVNGYLLPLTALLLLGGAAGDRYGRRRLLAIGTTLFAVASLLCALASALPWLLAGRVAQGVGAALLMPNSLAILGASFSGEARGKAVGTWAAVGAAAGALGPLLGGWLIDVFGWRSMFLVNLPIAVVAILLAWRYVQDQVGEKQPSLDLAGGLLATSGLGALTWGLTAVSGPSPAGQPAFLAMGAGVALLAAFLALEHRRGDGAMLPLAMFSSPSFVGLNMLTLLLYGALGGLSILIPYVLIEANGYSATAAGAALLPLPAGIALFSPTMGRLAEKLGPRVLLTTGPMVVAVGFLVGLRIGTDPNYWTSTFPAIVLIAAGMALAVAPLTTAVLSSVDAQHTGVASGTNSAVARGGGLLATALLGAVLASHGAELTQLYAVAAKTGAAAAVAAGLSALFWLRPKGNEAGS